MKIYPIIFALLFITSSCTIEETTENTEANTQNLSSKVTFTNNTPVSEALHTSLQYLSFLTAELLGEPSIQNEVALYLANTNGYTIPTDSIFITSSEVPLLRDGIIAVIENCGHPAGHHHRPGVQPNPGGDIVDNALIGFDELGQPWNCTKSYKDSVFYAELVSNNTTELFFPNGIASLEVRSSTSLPNLELLRANEGYLFFEDYADAEDFFELEYANEDTESVAINPLRINTANNFIPVKETKIIARLVQ